MLLVVVAVCLQALTYSQGSKTRYLVRLQLHEPASASLPALLQLKEGKPAAAAAAVKAALEDATTDYAEHAAAHKQYTGNGSPRDGADKVADDAGWSEGGPGDEEEAHKAVPG
jgi:hypothetical protein